MEAKPYQGERLTQHSLATYTSWRIGGVARCAYKPLNVNDLSCFLKAIPDSEPIAWLGLGSNVLIRDAGFPGTVILTQGCLNELDLLDAHTLRAEAGVTCAKLSKRCARAGMAAGAFFAGIPGTVGGALAMNAGAFGDETWSHVVAVETIDRNGVVRTRFPDEFEVRYRQVVCPAEEWFVAGHFEFDVGDADQINADIKALLKRRNATQPIGRFSCGSVFRNPEGDHAARLIESAGLKGLRVGGACVSEKHANFIINDQDATACDVETLISQVAARVFETHGVELIPEVHIIGEQHPS